MTERTVFECDATGERFGALNDVDAFEIRWRSARNPFHTWTETIHLSLDVLGDLGLYPRNVEYIGVEADGTVLGVYHSDDTYGGPCWRERGNVVIDHYEPFFEFLESEVLR